MGWSPVNSRAVSSSKPHIRLRHCNAVPAAPFIKLSIAHNVTTRPVWESKSKLTSAKLVPDSIFGSGLRKLPCFSRTIRTKGSCSYVARYARHRSLSVVSGLVKAWAVASAPRTISMLSDSCGYRKYPDSVAPRRRDGVRPAHNYAQHLCVPGGGCSD